MPPSIVHVMGWHSQQYGSFERFLVAVAERCAAAGIRTHLVFRSQPASERFVRDVQARVHVLPASRMPADPRFARDLRRILRAAEATHLHAHFGLDALNALAVARASGVRRRFATKHIVPGSSRRTLAGPRHRWLGAQVEVLFAVSAQVRELLVGLGVPAGKVEVAYIGVDTDVYHPSAASRSEVRRELGLPDDRRLVLSVSHLRPGKGVEQLPSLAEGLAARGIDATVVAAGDGPLRGELLRDAAARGLGEERLRLLGVREDVPRLLAAADAYVFPTTGTEGLPLAPLEALAAGAPVIATAVSDLPQLIGDVARIVEPGDPDALLEACADALTDPDRDARAGAARRLLEERLSVRRSAELHTARYLGGG